MEKKTKGTKRKASKDPLLEDDPKAAEGKAEKEAEKEEADPRRKQGKKKFSLCFPDGSRMIFEGLPRQVPTKDILDIARVFVPNASIVGSSSGAPPKGQMIKLEDDHDEISFDVLQTGATGPSLEDTKKMTKGTIELRGLFDHNLRIQVDDFFLESLKVGPLLEMTRIVRQLDKQSSWFLKHGKDEPALFIQSKKQTNLQQTIQQVNPDGISKMYIK
jgi:hypothetical protein